MIKSFKIAVICLGLMSGSALAENRGLFLGIGASEANTPVDDSLSGVMLQGGYQYNKYFGADLRLGMYSNEGASVFRDPVYKQYAFMGRVGYEWEQVSIYGLVGYANTLSSIENNDGGLSTGIEVNLFGSRTTALSFTFTNQKMNNDNIDTLSIGFLTFLGIDMNNYLGVR